MRCEQFHASTGLCVYKLRIHDIPRLVKLSVLVILEQDNHVAGCACSRTYITRQSSTKGRYTYLVLMIKSEARNKHRLPLNGPLIMTAFRSLVAIFVTMSLVPSQSPFSRSRFRSRKIDAPIFKAVRCNGIPGM
jgi:hypothetical protein